MTRRRRSRRKVDAFNGYAGLALKVSLTGAILFGYWLSVYSARVHHDSATTCIQAQASFIGMKARCAAFDEAMEGMSRFAQREKLEWQ